MRKFRLKIDLPFLPKGSIYWFDDETASVYMDEGGFPAEYSLRMALSSYLMLLRTEGKKYLKEV